MGEEQFVPLPSLLVQRAVAFSRYEGQVILHGHDAALLAEARIRGPAGNERLALADRRDGTVTAHGGDGGIVAYPGHCLIVRVCRREHGADRRRLALGQPQGRAAQRKARRKHGHVALRVLDAEGDRDHVAHVGIGVYEVRLVQARRTEGQRGQVLAYAVVFGVHQAPEQLAALQVHAHAVRNGRALGQTDDLGYDADQFVDVGGKDRLRKSQRGGQIGVAGDRAHPDGHGDLFAARAAGELVLRHALAGKTVEYDSAAVDGVVVFVDRIVGFRFQCQVVSTYSGQLPDGLLTEPYAGGRGQPHIVQLRARDAVQEDRALDTLGIKRQAVLYLHEAAAGKVALRHGRAYERIARADGRDLALPGDGSDVGVAGRPGNGRISRVRGLDQ